MIGVVPIARAMHLAHEAGLDLVEISPGAVPPVCKILSYSKYKYENKIKSKQGKKNQKSSTTKEIKLRSNIGQHDLDVKVKQMRLFFAEGGKVKISMRFRGREIAFAQLGIDLVNRVIKSLEDVAVVESKPKIESNQLSAVLSVKS